MENAILSEIVRGEYHLFFHLRIKGELLIWRAAWIVVHSLDVAIITANRDIVKAGNREALTRVRRGDETSF